VNTELHSGVTGNETRVWGGEYNLGGNEMPNIEDDFPTHEEIEAKAYEIYLHRGENSSAAENWLIAENQLRQERTSKPITSRLMAAGISACVSR
jgi:hypothetical protein